MLSITSSFIDHGCVYVSAQKFEAFSKICCWLEQRFLDSYSPRNATAYDESRNFLLIFGSFNLKVLPSSKIMSVSPSTAVCSWVVHSGFASSIPNVMENQHPVKKQSDQHIWTYRTSQLTCTPKFSKKLADSEANAYVF